MRKFTVLTFFFVLTMFFCVTIVRAENLPVPVPEVPPDETVSEEKDTVKDSPNEQKEPVPAPEASLDETVSEEKEPKYTGEELEVSPIKDPIQPFNRAMFTFNDKAFHYFIKPIYKGYSNVIPEKARISVRNFYTNIKLPIRFFNCLFQGKFKGAGTEGMRFLVNSTVGIAGFFDPAKSKFHIEAQDEDFGQTLGKYKMKSGIYIVWPFIGPSNPRDTIGLVGDAVLNPLAWVSYFFLTPIESIGNYTYENVNDVSIDRGDAYESITKPAIDPYIALQDAYIKNRIKKINDKQPEHKL